MSLKTFLNHPIGKVLQIFATIAVFLLLAGFFLQALGITSKQLAERNLARDALTGVLLIVVFVTSFLGIRTIVSLGSGQRLQGGVLKIISTEFVIFIVAALLAIGLQLGWFAWAGLTIV